MNVREGMRRVGLVAGVLGGIAGALAAYTQLQPLLAQRGQYKAFQVLVSSPTVSKEIEYLRASIRDQPLLPPGATPVLPVPTGGDWFQRNAPNSKAVSPPVSSPQATARDKDLDLLAALCGSTDGWKINKGGVRAIGFWGTTNEEKMKSRLAGNVTAADISDIETDDGQKLHDTLPPALSSYLLVLTFPALGFLVPWGAIRTLTWIGIGFSAGEAR